jgi:hypothetical protein
MWCQNRESEIGLKTDNDLYSSRYDMYYTNGLELFFRFVTKKNDNIKIGKKSRR